MDSLLPRASALCGRTPLPSVGAWISMEQAQLSRVEHRELAQHACGCSLPRAQRSSWQTSRMKKVRPWLTKLVAPIARSTSRIRKTSSMPQRWPSRWAPSVHSSTRLESVGHNERLARMAHTSRPPIWTLSRRSWQSISSALSIASESLPLR